MNSKTLAVLLLSASGISGATGTWAGGSRAEEKVQQLETKVNAITTQQGVIINELGHLKDSADEAKVSNSDQDEKLTRIITILEERNN